MANSKGGTFAMGAAAGGLLTVLLGSGKVRKLGGTALSYGGAAVLGGLAYRAWQEYQRQNETAAQGNTVAKSLPAPSGAALDAGAVSATDGSDFRMAILTAMIAAAKADGHVDGPEQERIFARVEEQGLSAEEKAFIFDELRRPLNIDGIAKLAADEGQASELWLASRLAIDPEDAYLDALAAKLKLPQGLAQQLDAQVRAALPE